MRRIFGLLFVVMVAASVAVFAQQSQPASATSQSQSSALSAEDAAAIREAHQLVKDLQAAYAGQRDQDGSNKQGESGPPKTVVDLFDKYLDKSFTLVGVAAKKIETAAPHVWRVMVWQQVAKGVSYLIVPWGLVLLCLLCMKVVNRAWKVEKPEPLYDKSRDEPTEAGVRAFLGKFVPMVLMFIFIVWGLNNLKSSVLLLMNPEYYAVKDLVTIVLNPGAIGS